MKVLLKVVEGLTVDDAVVVMQVGDFSVSNVHCQPTHCEVERPLSDTISTRGAQHAM